MTDEALRVADNRDDGRWEARLGDRLVGFSQYRRTTGRIVFTHTVVDPEYEGRGIGSQLARSAIVDAIENGLRITPYCPFIRAWLERHPQFDASVDFKEPRSQSDASQSEA